MAKTQTLTALDLGSSKIVTVIAQHDLETDKITIVGASSVPSRGIKQGQIVNLDEVTMAVEESVEAAERMAGVRISKLYVNVGSNSIGSLNSHGIVGVSSPEEEIVQLDVDRVIESAQAISFPAGEEVIHVLPMNFRVDSQSGIRDPVGMSGVRLEVDAHIITAPGILLRNIYKVVKDVGGDVAGVVYSGLASAQAVLSETEKELGVVMVDIGGGTTDIAIYVEGSLAYSAVLPIGGRHVTNDLAIGLKISLESAEKVKLALSEPEKQPAVPKQARQRDKLARSGKKKRAAEKEFDFAKLNLKEEISGWTRRDMVEGIIKERLNEIYDLVAAHIQKSGYVRSVPAGLVITGGGALTVDAITTAKCRLGVQVRLGQPEGIAGLVDEINNPAFATSWGLLLYAMRDHQTGAPGLSDWGSWSKSGVNVGGVAGKIVSVLKSILP